MLGAERSVPNHRGELTMFTNRFRDAALALAGAALIATSLMSSAALAAPSESQPSPSSAETFAAKPNLDLPRADGVINLNKIELRGGKPKYTFRVVNRGPDRASFKVTVEAGYRDCYNCDIKGDRVEETVTLNSGTAKEYQVECMQSAQVCESAVGNVVVVGVDPYDGNNVDVITH
jgi:hypothetical protein